MNDRFPLTSEDALTQLAKSNGAHSWNELTHLIQKLPYGRNSNRKDFALVITEKKGTCSSKHALLKTMADSNQIPNVKLILGMYRMNAANTPKIGAELSKHGLDFIPEAHCYLKIDGKRVDFTSPSTHFQSIEKVLLQEVEIEAEQVVAFKVNYHKDFIKKWLRDTDSNFEFDEIWQIREQCIQNLSQ